MKYTILFQAIVLVSAISIAQGQNWFSFPYILRKCQEIHEVQEDIKGCLINMVLPKDRRTYCAIGCFIKNIGFMNDDYTIDEYKTEKLLEKMNADIPINNLRFCNYRVTEVMESLNTSEHDKNECDAAEIFLRCLKYLDDGSEYSSEEYSFKSDTSEESSDYMPW